MYAQKWVRVFSSYETLKSDASHKWFDELSGLIKWFLHGDSDWIIFGLTTTLLCMFEICWVSTAVVLVKNNVLLVVPKGIGFPKFVFKKSLIKCGKFYSCLMKYSEKYEKWLET